MILQKIVPKFYKNESKVCPTFYFLQPILQNMIKIAPGGENKDSSRRGEGENTDGSRGKGESCRGGIKIWGERVDGLL